MTAREFLGVHGPVKDNHPNTSTSDVLKYLAAALGKLEYEAILVANARKALADAEATFNATRGRIVVYQETVQARVEKALAVATPQPVAPPTVDDGERGIRLREDQDGQGTEAAV